MKEILLEEVFTKQELKERSGYIRTLRHFGDSSVEAAKAIAAIKEKKLWRPHSTLREFCQRECGWTDTRLRQITTYLKIRASLPEKSQQLLSNEGQARELVRVPKEKLEEVMEEVQATNGEVTAKKIKAAVKRVVGGSHDDMGYPIPTGDASYFWNRKSDIEDLLKMLQRVKSNLSLVQTDDPLWSVIHPNGVIHDIESAISRISTGMPAYVCVYCEGVKPKSCQVCKGVGLVSKFMWKNTPVEKRQKRESATRSDYYAKAG